MFAKSSTIIPKVSSSSFNLVASGLRNAAANGGNVTSGGKIIRAIKNSSGYFNKSAEILGGGLIKYTKNLSPLLWGKSILAGNIGSGINSGIDLVMDVKGGKYFAAGMDVLGFGLGCEAGFLIEAGAALAVGTLGAPAIGVGLLAFGVIVAISMAIDYGTSKAKDYHYGGA